MDVCVCVCVCVKSMMCEASFEARLSMQVIIIALIKMIRLISKSTVLGFGSFFCFFFYSLFSALQIVSNMHAHVPRMQSFANHVQNTKHLSLATCHVPYYAKGQFSC